MQMLMIKELSSIDTSLAIYFWSSSRKDVLVNKVDEQNKTKKIENVSVK